MNDTKWKEIFQAFYYGVECSDNPVMVHWTTRSTGGALYNDSTWSHFGCSMGSSKEIEWLKSELTPQNRDIVLDILRQIHVPGQVFDDAVYVYGYRTDVDYIK